MIGMTFVDGIPAGCLDILSATSLQRMHVTFDGSSVTSGFPLTRFGHCDLLEKKKWTFRMYSGCSFFHCVGFCMSGGLVDTAGAAGATATGRTSSLMGKRASCLRFILSKVSITPGMSRMAMVPLSERYHARPITATSSDSGSRIFNSCVGFDGLGSGAGAAAGGFCSDMMTTYTRQVGGPNGN